MNDVAVPVAPLTLPYHARVIRTDRLRLRPFTHADLNDVLAYYTDPDVVRFLEWPVYTADEAAWRLKQRTGCVTLAEDHDELVYAVEPVSGAWQGHVIGEVIAMVDSVDHRRIEIGWIFRTNTHGNGYATEAARALMDDMLSAVNAHKIMAQLDARNTASAKVAIRLGMVREALFQDGHLSFDEWNDVTVYGMISQAELEPHKATSRALAR